MINAFLIQIIQIIFNYQMITSYPFQISDQNSKKNISYNFNPDQLHPNQQIIHNFVRITVKHLTILKKFSVDGNSSFLNFR
jgi:hypothetical protein